MCGLGAVLLIGTLVGTAFLMGACKLFNTMVHKPVSKNGVQMPDLGKAVGIVFATIVLNVAITFAIGFALGAGTAVAGGNVETARITTQLASNFIGFFVMCGLLTAILPTSFGRAALVALLYYAFAIIIAVMILLVIVAAVGSLPGG